MGHTVTGDPNDVVDFGDRPTLFDLFPGAAPSFIAAERGLSIQESFQQFHERNGWVYSNFVAMARDLVAHGQTRFGMKMLGEVLRWSYYRATSDENSTFKINNSYLSRYARLIEAQEPDLVGVFETRQLKAA